MNTFYDDKNFLKAGVRRQFEQESRRFQRGRTVEFEVVVSGPSFPWAMLSALVSRCE